VALIYWGWLVAYDALCRICSCGLLLRSALRSLSAVRGRFVNAFVVCYLYLFWDIFYCGDFNG